MDTARGLMGKITGQHGMVDMEQQRQQREKLLLALGQCRRRTLIALLIQLDKTLPDEVELFAVNALVKVVDIYRLGKHG